MSRLLFSPLAAALLVGLTVTACTTARSPAESGGTGGGMPGRSSAVAHLRTDTGKPSGRAELTETPSGVQINVSVQGLTPGLHGFHIHTNGACAPGPDAATGQTVAFGAAGGHFDPGVSRKHGRPGEPVHLAHAGELPNITVGADGQGSLRYLRPGVTLSRDAATSVFGRSLVVHERADDYATDPAGNSGGRVLCGVIEAG